jgi:DinB family protein
MDQWLVDFKQTIDSGSTRLRQISESQSGKPRAEDHWSSKQILGHLIDSAANNHARFVLGQLKDDLIFPGYDQDGWVRTNHYQEAPWSQLVELWRSYNLHLHHLMTHADQAKLNTPCTLHTLQEIAFKTVAQTEPVTLEYLMQDYVVHLQHHLHQIFGDAPA